MSGRKRREREAAELLASRPFWQASACPAWCVTGPHAVATPPEDRLHESEPFEIVLSMLGALEHERDEWLPQTLIVNLRQEYRDAEPAVVLATGQRPDMPLTYWEAGALYDALHMLLDMAQAERAAHAKPKKRRRSR